MLCSGVHVRRRASRYRIDVGGAAVDEAGGPPGRLEVAGRVVEDESWPNASRQGIVFVGAFAGGVSVPWLALGVEDASRALRGALLDLDAG